MARIGRTRGRVYISNAIWTIGIINIIGRRKYISDVVPFNHVGVLFILCEYIQIYSYFL